MKLRLASLSLVPFALLLSATLTGSIGVPVPEGLPTSTAETSSAALVEVHHFRFQDSDTNHAVTAISAGESVTWTWVGGGHSVTSGFYTAFPGAGDEYNSRVLSAGSTFTVQFDEPGIYPYFCIPHQVFAADGNVHQGSLGPAGMRGVVVVGE